MVKNLLLVSILLLFSSCASAQDKNLTGELKRWHKVTLKLEGPSCSESGENNPFLNYRLNVTFTHPESGTSYTVPGYFSADGNDGETSATSGNIWKAHLSPDHTGTWTYKVSFEQGENIAVSQAKGKPVTDLEGLTGSFEISESDKTGRDFRAPQNGRLKYVGKRYLKYSGSDRYFLKQGADAPENFLNYADFDGIIGTPQNKQGNTHLKTWSAHIKDWQDGDPTWKNGKGKGMIGAINYLASEGMNVFSFLTMNLGGDDNNCFPYVITDNKTEKKYPGVKKKIYVNANRKIMDCSKLDQWETVFEHGTKMGMYLHFKTQETENDHLLDGGELGVERKLYYRELIARFGHHLALNWNLGEETTNSINQLKSYCEYFYDNDPYRHNVVLHTYPGQWDKYYFPLIGDKSYLSGLSIQTSKKEFSQVFKTTKKWVTESEKSGKPWIVAVDEPGDASLALRPDADAGNSHEDGRRYALWGTFLAGGAGNEWYFGYKKDHSDLTCQDFRSRDKWWDYCRFALQFMNSVPFAGMTNNNELIGNSADNIKEGFCFAKTGSNYVVYLPHGGSKSLDLSNANGEFTVKWFNPRNGGQLHDGSISSVKGGAKVSIGFPPNDQKLDWVAYISLKQQ